MLNVRVILLPTNTTSLLQPLDAGVVASVKMQYRKRVIERAVDLLENDITIGLFDVDLRSANLYVVDIWIKMERSMIINCWRTTELVNLDSSARIHFVDTQYISSRSVN